MLLSTEWIVGSLSLAAVICAAPAPVPVDTAEVIEWAKANNVDIPDLEGSVASNSASALADWAKSNDIDVTTEGATLIPAPGATDALAAWAEAHNVVAPEVGLNFEGTADYAVY
ncbi:hypothetical protein F5Y01DRAFT_322157 [Xylaria sp. FL0043]|nr:hypothetical protein F5Y01DRAFT_322157 [Xylaria sp. FL0043]